MAVLKIINDQYKSKQDLYNLINYCLRKGIILGGRGIMNPYFFTPEQIADQLFIHKYLLGLKSERNVYHMVFSFDEYIIDALFGNTMESQVEPRWLGFAIEDVFNQNELIDYAFMYAIHKGWSHSGTRFHIHAHIIISDFSTYGNRLQNKNTVFKTIMELLFQTCKQYQIHFEDYPKLCF